MDTLRERLAELADDAPTGGAPAAELWARGKRAHRLRAAALAATLLVVGAVGTGIGVRLADGDGNRSGIPPAGTGGIVLPIEYPAGEELPDLGDTPGPLAAIWLAPRVDGGPPEAVGLVAATGAFGTLPIAVNYNHEHAADAAGLELSSDGRRIAYESLLGGLIVHHLVSGSSESVEFEGFGTRAGYTWVDATHLVGHVAGGSDVDGWVWEPGTGPKRVNLLRYPGSPWLGPYGGRDPWFVDRGAPHSCQPTFQDKDGPFYEVVLCDVVGVIGSEIVLTHDGNGRVVAVDKPGADVPFEDPAPRQDPALRFVVDSVSAPQARGGQGVAPWRVTFATDLIGEVLDADGGAS